MESPRRPPGFPTSTLPLLLLLLLPCCSNNLLCEARRFASSYAEDLNRAFAMGQLGAQSTEQLLSQDAAASEQLLSLLSSGATGSPPLPAAVLSARTLLADREGLLRARAALSDSKVVGDTVKNAADEKPSLETCLDDLILFQAAVEDRETWALRMLDAFGKPSPGVFDLNVIWPGAYDECHDVTFSPNMTQNMTSDGHSFTGQYCNARFPVVLMNSVIPAIDVKEGLCVPSSCADYDILFLLNTLMIQYKYSVEFAAVVCHEKNPPLDTLAIVALAVCGALVLLLVTGTAVDVLLVQLPRQRSEDTLNMLMSGVDSKGEREPLLESAKQTYSYQLGRCSRLLATFSLYSNVVKLLDTRQASGSLTCVHGLRVVSMAWVVLGHAVWVPFTFAGLNIGRWSATSLKRFMFQLIINATLAVDTFFLLSGLLVAYVALRAMHRLQGKLNWGMFYVHRFWRLTPVYALVVFLYVASGQYWGDGPLWPRDWPDRDNCRTSWWTNLLYVNNLVKTDEMCFGHSWYLADDMQFYILSPLIFVPFYYSAVYGAVSALLFLAVSTATPAVLTMLDKLPAGPLAKLDDTPDPTINWVTDFYIVPYTRMAPYVVGIVTGYVIYRTKARLRMPKVVVLLGWLVAGSLGLAAVFGLYDATANTPMPLWQAAFYNAAGRTAWALAVAWVVLACVTGNGGVVNSILSWRALVPVSRLTYCVYLVHLPLIYTVIFSRRTVFFVADMDLVVFFLGMLVLAHLAGAVLTLTLEAPMMGVEKELLRDDDKPDHKPDKKHTQRQTFEKSSSFMG